MWEEAEKHLLKDKYIAPLIKKHGPCKIKPLKKKDYFSDLVDAIVSQQLSGKAAKTIFGRVKEKLGEVTPSAVLKVSGQDLRDCGMSWAKVAGVKDLADRVVTGKLHVAKLGSLSDEEVKKELVAVRGIGPWTAEMFLMFTLGRADIFSEGDLGLKKGIEKVTGKEFKIKELSKFASRWKPYRTVASWYLWRALEN